MGFDATYKKNRYNKLLVIFSGMNNHRQTIVFACVFGDATEETYTWVLQQFLECMSGKKPLSIVTNGNRAMRQAITWIFPDSCHRLCSWHFIRNCTSNISNVNFVSAFKKCMFGDYEVGWIWGKVSQYSWIIWVDGYKWIEEIYKKKHMWTTSYLRGKSLLVYAILLDVKVWMQILKKYIW